MEQYLIHHGIKGQKWGVRRYQKEDGTLTAEGQKRYTDSKPQTSRRPAHGFYSGFAAYGSAGKSQKKGYDPAASARSELKRPSSETLHPFSYSVERGKKALPGYRYKPNTNTSQEIISRAETLTDPNYHDEEELRQNNPELFEKKKEEERKRLEKFYARQMHTKMNSVKQQPSAIEKVTKVIKGFLDKAISSLFKKK